MDKLNNIFIFIKDKFDNLIIKLGSILSSNPITKKIWDLITIDPIVFSIVYAALFLSLASLCLLVIINIFSKNIKRVKFSNASQVFEFIGKDKNELFLKSQEWFVESFSGNNCALEINDKESGIVKGKPIIDMFKAISLRLHGHYKGRSFRGNYCISTFVISIVVKDEKCKIDIKEINREYGPKRLYVFRRIARIISHYSDSLCVAYRDYINNSKKLDF